MEKDWIVKGYERRKRKEHSCDTTDKFPEIVETTATMLKSSEITRLFLILQTCFDGNFRHHQCNGCLQKC